MKNADYFVLKNADYFVLKNADYFAIRGISFDLEGWLATDRASKGQIKQFVSDLRDWIPDLKVIPSCFHDFILK